MNKKTLVLTVVFAVVTGLAIADDILIPGKPMANPWYTMVLQYVERLFQVL